MVILPEIVDNRDIVANATSPAYYPSPFQGYNSPGEDYYLIIC